ncbi:MAG: tetratricopeptide repeat protein [Okeania sp. SIO1H6]|nr:tetratricopeptide repeat protein [Okeania sp. SIO1H6]
MSNESMSAGQLLKQANRLKREGRLDEAIALYHQVIDINPNFAWAYNNLGDAFVKQEKLDEAVVEYQKAIKINPNSAWFYINLGRLLIQQGCFEEAIGYFRQAIETKPDLLYEFNGKYFQLFRSTFQNESCSFCLSEDEDFIKLKEEPIWITLPVKPFTNYCLCGRSSSPQPPTRNQALVQVEFLDENQQLIPSPYSGIPHSQTIGPYFYISTSDESLSEFKTNTFNTTSVTHYLRLGFRTWHNKKPMVLDSRLRLGFDLLLYGLEKLSNHNDNSANILPYAFLYYSLGNALFKSNRLEEATFAYQKAIQLYPCFAQCHNKLGEAQLKKGEHSQAVSSFRQAVALNPNKAWFHLNLGEALTNSGGWLPTLNCYRSAVKLDPSQIIIHQTCMEIQPDKPSMIQVNQPIFIVGCGHSGTSIMLAILGSHPSLYPIPYESALFLKSESRVREVMLGWDKECTEAGKKRWIEKTPPHIFIIKKLFSYRPSSKFIIMLRDGRDVVCSMKHRTDYEDFNTRLNRWIYDNLAGLLYWKHPRVKVVKYENLITDTELTLKDILNFLGEKYIDSLLKFHKTARYWYSSEIVKPEEVVDMETHKQLRNWQINQPLFNGSGKWKVEMTEEEKVLFKAKAQKYLVQFGYVANDDW